MSKNSVTTKQHVRASIRDGIYTSLNMGMAESYFAAFMLALGISEVITGVGTVIPQFIGVLFQLFSIRSFFTRYSLKKRLILFLSLQALSMVPLILAGTMKINSPYFIISVLSLYWASLLSLNPPWNRLMGNTVPVMFRLKFFSIRSQFSQFSVFLGLLASGLFLHVARDKKIELPVYVGIFAVGFLLKCMSIVEIQKYHKDFELPPGSEPRVRLRDFLRRFRGTEQGKLITFLFLFFVTIHFSAPYFNPYMLGRLKFNYLEFMGICSLGYFGRVFMFRLLQKRARSRHIELLLLLSTIGISSTPLLWAISQEYWWIAIIEFFSGCYWAGFELSTILLYYQKIDDRERTSVMTYITLLNTTGMFLGSLLGAGFMKILPTSWDPYITLFAVSTFLRVSLVVFAPQVDFKGQIPKLIRFNRVMNVRPPFGALTRPIVGKVKKKDEEKRG
ncbi:MAG: MFS transporter [Bacteriovoracia bacterium]